MLGAGSQGLRAGKGTLGGGRGLEGALSPLTKFIPIKLGVEVPRQVKGHLDLISYRQPPAGDGLTQVLGQGSSKTQARAGVGRGGYSRSAPGSPCMLGGEGAGVSPVLGQDVGVHGVGDPRVVLVGGHDSWTPRARWCSVQGLRDPPDATGQWGLAAAGTIGHMQNRTKERRRPCPVTIRPPARPHPSGGTSPLLGSTPHGCTKTPPRH